MLTFSDAVYEEGGGHDEVIDERRREGAGGSGRVCDVHDDIRGKGRCDSATPSGDKDGGENEFGARE